MDRIDIFNLKGTRNFQELQVLPADAPKTGGKGKQIMNLVRNCKGPKLQKLKDKQISNEHDRAQE
jgi:hypothetical protein